MILGGINEFSKFKRGFLSFFVQKNKGLTDFENYMGNSKQKGKNKEAFFK